MVQITNFQLNYKFFHLIKQTKSQKMLPSLHNDNAYFHQTKKPRYNNPTFVSTFMTDSLTTLNPPSQYTKNILKETEYKQNFEKCNSENKLSIYSVSKASNYAKFSKAAFQKTRSNMSNYGATILGQSNKPNY